MGGIIDKAASVLERRFLKNAFLPVLLFLPALAAPVLLQEGRLAAAARLWERQSGTIKALEIVGYLALVWFVASVVASQWRNIIRLFEGYDSARRASRGQLTQPARRAPTRVGRAARRRGRTTGPLWTDIIESVDVSSWLMRTSLDGCSSDSMRV